MIYVAWKIIQPYTDGVIISTALYSNKMVLRDLLRAENSASFKVFNHTSADVRTSSLDLLPVAYGFFMAGRPPFKFYFTRFLSGNLYGT